MIVLGLSEGYHDAGACLIEDGEILSATHAERLSRKKNDRWLHKKQIHLTNFAHKIAFHEKTWLKFTRQLYSGQKRINDFFDLDMYEHSYYHHQSHAAAGFYTSEFDRCNILVIDAIGEWDTVSVWEGWVNKDKPKMKKVWSRKYPYSIGLFYSAITKAIGLKPQEDEYITMGMAAYGEPKYYDQLKDILHYHNCHRGLPYILKGYENDIAASAQLLVEDEIVNIVKEHCHHQNLVMMGGVALNCVANSRVARLGKKIWIMPNPGDCGSALGAAALAYGKKIKWEHPYLGTEIKGDVNVKDLVNYLLKNQYCGIANSFAEFGPRALGNRSLVADPRYDIKDTVNKIKRRQRFRPFAPAILEEFAQEYFEGPMNEYMQFVAMAKHDYDSVTHIDGTARVQIVKKDCNSIIRPLLESWYDKTKCPMLLNTSLNIKGQPMVDNENDKRQFMKEYKVKVF
tara:strand:+ start:276 stop:1643 length:1368 start_codon:yes stop_codon:yes gene_type:complete